MGSLMIGQVAALSPDFGKGRIGAAYLFKLFNTVPAIDSASEKGFKPVSLFMSGQRYLIKSYIYAYTKCWILHLSSTTCAFSINCAFDFENFWAGGDIACI